MLLAGLDGIQNRIDPGKPIDKNLYDLPPAEAKEVKSTPGSLEQALDALEADHAFLLRGDVFTKDVIETWLGYKRDKEVMPSDCARIPYGQNISPRLPAHTHHLSMVTVHLRKRRGRHAARRRRNWVTARFSGSAIRFARIYEFAMDSDRQTTRPPRRPAR